MLDCQGYFFQANYIMEYTLHICVYNLVRGSVVEVMNEVNNYVETSSRILLSNFLNVGSYKTGGIPQWTRIVVTVHDNFEVIDAGTFIYNGQYVQCKTPEIDNETNLEKRMKMFKYTYTYENEFPFMRYEDTDKAHIYRFKPIPTIDEWDLRDVNVVGFDFKPNTIICQPINTVFETFKQDFEKLLNSILLTHYGKVTSVHEKEDRTIEFSFTTNMTYRNNNAIIENLINILRVRLNRYPYDLIDNFITDGTDFYEY